MFLNALGRATISGVKALSDDTRPSKVTRSIADDSYAVIGATAFPKKPDIKLTISARELAASVDLKALHSDVTGVKRLTIINDADLVMGGVAGNVDVIAEVGGKLGYEVLVLGPHNVGGEIPFASQFVEKNFAKNARIPYRVSENLAELERSIGGYGRVLIMTERNFGRGARDFFVSAGIPFASAYCSKYETMAEDRLSDFLSRNGTTDSFATAAGAYARRFITNELVDLHLAAHQTITPQPVVEHLAKMGVPLKKITPWTHDVNTKDFSPSKRSTWDKLGVPNVKEPVLLVASRISPEKNVPLIAKVKDWPGTIIVMGDGPMLEQYRQEMPFARFIGRRSGEDLFSAYATADFFLQTSAAETFGRTTLEAMASGCTIIGLDTPVNRFVCGDTQAAFLGDDLPKVAQRALAARANNRDAQMSAALEQSTYFTREATAGIAIKSMLDAGGPRYAIKAPTLTGRDYERAVGILRADDLRTLYPEGHGQPPTMLDAQGRTTRDNAKLLELRGLT